MSKKMINIIVTCLIVFLLPTILLFIPKKRQAIENAMVNSETGDIAIVYYNFGNGGTIELFLYDVEGALLFHKSHPSSGGSHSKIFFVGTDVHIYVSRTDTAYAYGRDGYSVGTIPSNEWRNITSNDWIGWESELGSKKYETKEYIYFYKETPYPESLLSSKCYLEIYNKDTESSVVLFEFE